MHRATNQPRTNLSAIAIAAIAGQLFLLASAMLLPTWSEFGLVGDNISELALGRFGVVQTIAFFVSGLTTLGLAYAIRQMTAGTWGSLVGSLFVGVYGLGAGLVALFPTDRIDVSADVWSQSTTGMIHIVVTLVSFFSMIVGMFVLVRTFLLAPGWRPIFPWTVLIPAGSLSLVIAQSEGPLVGLLQRLLVGLIAAWIIMVAARVIIVTAAPPTGNASHHGLAAPDHA